MAYATQADLEQRFGLVEIIQLTEKTGGNIVNVAVLTLALADAEAVIDGYLRHAYSLPLSNVSPELVRICCDLTRYFLYEDGVPESVKLRRDDAISWLRDVSLRRVSLGANVAGGVAPVAASSGIVATASARVFTPATLAKY